MLTISYSRPNRNVQAEFVLCKHSTYTGSVFVQLACANSVVMFPPIFTRPRICDPADVCLWGDYSQLRRPCAAVKHTGSIGLKLKMRPAPTKTLQLPPRLTQYMGYRIHLGFGIMAVSAICCDVLGCVCARNGYTLEALVAKDHILVPGASLKYD